MDQVFEIEKGQFKSYRSVIEQIKGHQYRLILCPHQSFTSARFVHSLSAEQKVGFKSWWNFLFFQHRVEKDLSLPDSLRQLSLLKSLFPQYEKDLEDFKVKDQNWHLSHQTLSPVPEWASPRIDQKVFETLEKKFLPESFAAPSPVVVIFPGSVWKTKQWTEEGFKEVVHRLCQDGYQVKLLGVANEKELCDRIATNQPQCQNLAGELSLIQSLLVLSKAQFVIANDSGGQHLASLAGIKTVSVFGPTVLSLGYRPWNSKAIVVENKGLSCRPCGKHGHQKCPLGTHECMKSIGSKDVLQALGHLKNLEA
jgi:heptosyltransferase-2